MRWVFLLILIASIPVFTSYAKGRPRKRDHMILVAGLLMFATGSISLDASIIGQPDWPGPSKGVIVSFVDVIAIALIFTRKSSKQSLLFLSLFGLHLFAMLFATAFAHSKMASFYSISQYAQLILLFCALSPEFNRPTATASLLKGLAIGLAVQAVMVLYQKSTGMVQAFGTTPHQNILGMMVQLTVFPMLAALMEGARSKLLILGVFSGAICVALGGSRASVFFFAVGIALLIVLTFIRRPTGRKGKILAGGVVMALLFVPLASGTLRERFGETEIGTTDDSRIAFERSARAMSADHPFGVGPNNFVPVNNLQGYAKAAGLEWGGGLLDKPVHNAYLLARTETGWFGQGVLFSLFVATIFSGLRGAFMYRKAPVSGIGLGSAVSAFTIALHSNYEFAWFTIEVQRLFFANCAIVAACFAIALQARKEDEAARRARHNSLQLVPQQSQ